MDTIIKGLPGYRINEYLVVLNPHEELKNKIRKIQQEFGETYQVNSFGMKPNIPLVKFTQYEMMEERILSKLKTVALSFYPFKVELKDYGTFPSHTIFINVTGAAPVTSLVKQIRKEAGRLLKFNEDNKPHFFTDPIIPIGRKLSRWQFEKASMEYHHRFFTGKFIADSMLFLKRPQGQNNYQVVERMEFQNLAIPVVQQGELF